MVNYSPSLSELFIAKKVLYAVNRNYHPLKEKSGDMAVHLDLCIEEIDAMMSGMCAAVVEDQENDIKRPEANYGRFRPTLEGTPEWEYAKLQREENASANFYNPRDDD